MDYSFPLFLNKKKQPGHNHPDYVFTEYDENTDQFTQVAAAWIKKDKANKDYLFVKYTPNEEIKL